MKSYWFFTFENHFLVPPKQPRCLYWLLISILGRSLSYGSTICCTCFLRSFFLVTNSYLLLGIVFFNFEYFWTILILIENFYYLLIEKQEQDILEKKLKIGGRHVMNPVQISFLAERTSSWWKCSSSFSVMGSSLISSTPFTPVKNLFRHKWSQKYVSKLLYFVSFDVCQNLP